MKIGDCVRLNSGGPPMHVFDIDYWGNVWCNWMNERGLCAASFPPVCLDLIGATA